MMGGAYRIHAMVISGGSGARLGPLTTTRSKPALRFGTEHRVVDFVLANLRNSGIRRANLLVQYEPEGLIEHVQRHWGSASSLTVTAVASRAGRPYRGTADAVFQNLHVIDDADDSDLVAVFGADHIYRMDLRQMTEFHLANDAHVTAATLPVSLKQARAFGVLGHHVLPRLLQQRRLFAYDFTSNVVAGLVEHEERGYWRDVGTIDAYVEAQMDTLGSSPRFLLDNPSWPISTGRAQPRPALVVGGQSRASRLGRGARIDRASLEHVIAGSHSRVGAGAKLERCVLFDGTSVGRGAQLRNVIVDEGNAIPANEVIGFDAEFDRRRFPGSEDGVVVIPRGHYATAQVLAVHG